MALINHARMQHPHEDDTIVKGKQATRTWLRSKGVDGNKWTLVEIPNFSTKQMYEAHGWRGEEVFLSYRQIRRAVDNRPSTNKLKHFIKKTKKIWHLIRAMWHVSYDMWHVKHWGKWTLSQNCRSLALTVWKLWCFEDCEDNGQVIT